MAEAQKTRRSTGGLRMVPTWERSLGKESWGGMLLSLEIGSSVRYRGGPDQPRVVAAAPPAARPPGCAGGWPPPAARRAPAEACPAGAGDALGWQSAGGRAGPKFPRREAARVAEAAVPWRALRSGCCCRCCRGCRPEQSPRQRPTAAAAAAVAFAGGGHSLLATAVRSAPSAAHRPRPSAARKAWERAMSPGGRVQVQHPSRSLGAGLQRQLTLLFTILTS